MEILGINTDYEIIKKSIAFLLKINYTGRAHLMPYNKMAKSKYKKIGKTVFYQDMGDLFENCLNSILSLFSAYKFEVVANR